MDTTMQHLPFRDWTIAYRRMGIGPSVLFLHNGGTSHRIWLDVMETLADRFDVIAIDLLGYGESSKPGESYTMDVYVDLVRTVLDTLDIRDVALVGNCMGSAISLHFARQYPDRVRQLVLINPLTEATFSGGWLAGVLKARQLAPSLVGGVYRAISGIRLPRWTAGSTLEFQVGRRGRKRGVHKDASLQQLHTSDGQLRSLLAVLADIDAYAALDQPGFSTGLPPIYSIWGESNRILSAKVGQRLNGTLQPRSAHSLPDCGHLVMMEAPQEVAALIASFLTGASENKQAEHAV